MGFADNALGNGLGADLVLFELGALDTFNVTINGLTRAYLAAFTNEILGNFGLNAAAIDLNDFGLAAGAQVTRVEIGLDTVGSTGTVPSLSLAGALNPGGARTVSEPASLALAGLALAGLAALRRRSK